MASYLGNSPDTILQVRKRNFRYVATANQTAFTGVDSNSLTMEVNTSDVEVFLNGVLLDQTDYTITSTVVTLGAGATVNDIIEVITNTTFVSSDVYTKTETDTKVATAISDLVGTAGAALNTLGELSDALADDANYASTITTALSTKANASDVTTALGLKANSSSLGTLATISPTGTASSSTFLRGDNSWQTVSVTPTAVSDQNNTSTGYFDLPSGTTAQRPGSPTDGMTRYNTTLQSQEYYANGRWNTVVTQGVAISSISPTWQYLPTVNTSVSAVTFNDSNYWGAYFAVPTAGNGETQLAGYEYPLVGKFNTRSTYNNDSIFQLYGFGNGSGSSGFWDSDTFFQMGVVFTAPPYGGIQTNSLHATSALTAGNGVYAVGKGYGTGTWSFYNGGGNSNSSSQTSTNRETAQTVSWTGQPITFVVKRDTDPYNPRRIAMYIGDTQVYKWTQTIPANNTFVGIYVGNGYGSSSGTIWNRDKPRFRYADYSSSMIQMA